MSDGTLDRFWGALQRAEQRVEAEARDAQRSLYRTLYGYENRVMRLRWALEASGPLARKEITSKLKHVSLDAVWQILLSIVKDIALYYGGSVVLGTAVGAGVGSLFFGAGAIPGAALGFEAGMVLGEWVMMYLGLKMLAEGLIDTIPPAMNCYVEGFRAAWGPTDSDRPDARYLAGYAPSKETAAQRFAQGHVLMIMAILIAIVAYLSRGKSKEALFKAVGDSKRLGSKMADWLKDNEANLLKEESLQPKVRLRAEAPAPARAPETRPRRASSGSTAAKTSGETKATASGKAVHKRLAAERRASGDFDLVNQPITDADGNPIKVTHRVDLETGEGIPESGYQEARPDAVQFKNEVILDDKPLGRPVAKDQQEIIRFIKAYQESQGGLPKTIGIQRYDPLTGEPVMTEMYKPGDFMPWEQ